MERQKIVKIFSQFSLEDYDLELHPEGSKLGLSMRKDDLEILRYISFFLDSTNQPSPFDCSITIKRIEDIVSPILRDCGIIGGKQGELMVTTSFYHLENTAFNEYFSNFIYKIEDPRGAYEFLEMFKEFILNIAEPFYQKWSDLNRLNIYLEQLPQQDVGRVLGQGGAFRKAIVYYLCGNDKFKVYFDMIYSFYIDRYIETPDADESYKKWNDAAIRFKDVLEILPENKS